MIIAGEVYGALTVISVRRGSKGVHPLAICECSCGNKRRVRQTALRTGRIFSCGPCSLKRAWVGRPRVSQDERLLREQEGHYRGNAAKKGHVWELDRQRFRELVGSPCRYCGTTPSRGIDRKDNRYGYTVGNSVPCCALCNYGKRNLNVEQFIAWVARVHRHNGGQNHG